MTDVFVDSKDVVVEVKQPTVPAAAKPPNIGLVEINQVVQRGSAWMTGNGPPTLPGGQYGDMYLDATTGDMYQWNGNAWEYVGTFAPSTLTPEEILEAIITVDGDGSDLDADLLDGQHGVYYAKQSDMTIQTDKNTAQDSRLDANDAKNLSQDNNIVALQTAVQPANLLTSIKTVDGPGSGLDADTLDGHDTPYFATQADLTAEATSRANADTAEATTRGAADTALQGQITTEKNRNDTQDTTIATKVGEAPNDGGQYVRKNLAWALVSVPPGTIVSDTAPASPPDNQLWVKGTTGVLYIWFRDADGAQWIQLSASPQIVDQNYTRKTARTRNRITNPTAQISQQYPSTVLTASGYPADQIATGSSGIVYGGQKAALSTTTPEGTTTAVSITATTAKASLAATDYLYMILPVEGYDIADLLWGTANAKQVVVRFCAVCDQAGTYGFAITNGAGDRAWCGSFAIAQAGVPQVFTIVVPGDTTGTWPTDDSYALSVRFSYAYGSNYAGAAGWGAGNKMGVAGTTNGAAVANSKLFITDVGLYADPDNTGLAPPFVVPSFKDELERCKRYWEKSYAYDVAVGTVAQAGAHESGLQSGYLLHSGSMRWQVEKRAAPTIALYATQNGAGSAVSEYNTGGTFVANRSPQVVNISANAIETQIASGAGTTGNIVKFHWSASARLV